MVAESADPSTKKKRRTLPHKLNPQKVLQLRRRGLSTPDIARHQGVANSTVWRFLERSAPEQKALEDFKANRADAFANLQGCAIGVQHKIIERLGDGVLDALTPASKAQLLTALNNVQGTIYDKERLERGESTANVSTVSRMISGEVGALYKAKPLITLKTGKAKKVADPV